MKLFVLLLLVVLAFSANFMGLADFVRHKKLNYSFERNDAVLLEKLSLPKPRNWQEEEICLQKIAENSEKLHNHALLLAGGFCDGMHAYLYRVIPELRKIIAEKNLPLDVYYREHDELHGIKELFTLYHKQGKKIVIVGHSWGACSVFKQFWQDSSVPIDLLVSLDPVGLVRPKGRADHIKTWINVYLDYSSAPLTFSNTVARIGQPFGKRSNADENIKTAYNHQQAQKMFFDYAFDKIEQIIK